ncbi:DUF6542 domain-containing protein [Streptacidiphilus cavernicola]|uniref:DUF6542 domain-containing protein n=1 Tax=Streptacidiphilus cavernicola TaxID=3342716 RepID=A0ABV6VUM6_9ACTN
MPDARTTDRPGAATAPRRAAGVPGPARSPEPAPRAPEPRQAAGARTAPRPGPRSGGSSAPHRLTAVGGAVVTLGATLLGGAIDFWLFGGTGIVMGLAYIATCFQVAVRVRAADLAIAPVSGPIAFAATLLVMGAGPDHSVLGRIIGLATALALQAGWLFSGTAVSVLIVLARRIALNRARRRAAQ